MDDELGRRYEEAALIWFRVGSLNFFRTEENQSNFSPDGNKLSVFETASVV
jgi:hypothetical protein